MAGDTAYTFSPGDRVILGDTGECGVVVYSWRSEEAGTEGVEDCYVAFFGKSFPEKDRPPQARPMYVLRYFAASLTRAPNA